MSASVKAVGVCLATVILSLLLVGVVSGTLIRHIVQVSPAAVALAATVRCASWATWAAIPVFLFWFLIMLAIWLFLLGISKVVTGHFAPAEIVLTIAVGISCVAGLVGVLRSPAERVGAGSAISALFALLQFAAIWLSYKAVH